MRIRFLLFSLSMIVVPSTNAIAAIKTECQTFLLKGKVRTMSVTSGRINLAGGASAAPTKESDVAVDAERRVMTEVLYQSGNLLSFKQSFPRTTSRFDGRGLLVEQVIARDGQERFTTIHCTYDAQGRVLSSTMRSRNPELNQTVTFEYSAGIVRQRFKTAVASLLVTQSLDSQGRVIRETEGDEQDRQKPRIKEFTYGVMSTTMCTVGEARPICSTTVTDESGNEVEFRVGAIRRRTTYEYDRAGNWVSRRIEGGTEDRVTRRAISYWP
jgi:hypothetical protein